MWTPADWAWAGGLLNALMPSLHYGVPVVAWPHDKFEPEEALGLIARPAHHATPSCRRRRCACCAPSSPARALSTSPLRNIVRPARRSAPRPIDWAREAFGLPVDELYGQTECNLVLGSSPRSGVARPGSTGKPVPGHRVAILRPDGSEPRPDEPGEIACPARPGDVLALLEPAGGDGGKFRGDWMLTGDQARRDADGYIHFVGRDDDLITSAGYRIGPTEIEDCLLRHPAVAPTRRRSASPMRCAPRSSRPSSC